MKKDVYGGTKMDFSEMFEPKHDNGFEGQESELGTWAFVVTLIILFAVGIIIANHFGLSIY